MHLFAAPKYIACIDRIKFSICIRQAIHTYRFQMHMTSSVPLFVPLTEQH